MKDLAAWLERFPADALVYGYEGEGSAGVVVRDLGGTILDYFDAPEPRIDWPSEAARYVVGPDGQALDVGVPSVVP